LCAFAQLKREFSRSPDNSVLPRLVGYRYRDNGTTYTGAKSQILRDARHIIWWLRS